MREEWEKREKEKEKEKQTQSFSIIAREKGITEQAKRYLR